MNLQDKQLTIACVKDTVAVGKFVFDQYVSLSDCLSVARENWFIPGLKNNDTNSFIFTLILFVFIAYYSCDCV